MVALARAMRDREGIGVAFFINGSADALEPARAAGFEARLLTGSPASTLKSAVEALRPDILICDLREGLSRQELDGVHPLVQLVAVIDDASNLRLAADLAYYPQVPQAERLDWSDSRCIAHVGWQWSLLGLARIAVPLRNPLPRPTLLVAMGGSDPLGLTLTAARALSGLDPYFVPALSSALASPTEIVWRKPLLGWHPISRPSKARAIWPRNMRAAIWRSPPSV
jgi:spore coat polysaccharide biosynthesis protein SpsF